MSSLQEFLNKFSKQAPQQQQVQNPQLIQDINNTNLVDLISSVKQLFQVVKARHWEPRTFLVLNALPMNNGTDEVRLAGFTVPNNKIYVLTNYDIVYTSTGSFRIKCQWGSMGIAVDILENTATNAHWYGYLVMDPGSVLSVTQGATTSGSGNLDGSFAGLVFDVV